MKPPLYYLGKPADGFGWGVCNTNLARALAEFFEVLTPDRMQTRFDAPVFVPLNGYLSPSTNRIEAPATYGYCFTEEPLPPEAKRNARGCDWIFTGSTWNTQRLTDAGILNCSTLVQGVDLDAFPEQPWKEDLNGFRVFSGGKFEFRKGQDIVVAAMDQFMAVHQDTFLITSWHNPWPASQATMQNSPYIDHRSPVAALPAERVIQLPAAPNRVLGDVYGQTHVGLFPNRCEAGTNLVLMEYMASGRPAIVSAATGHLDLLNGPGPWEIRTGDGDWAGWFHASVSGIIVALEEAYRNRKALKERGRQCRELICPWTWNRAATLSV